MHHQHPHLALHRGGPPVLKSASRLWGSFLLLDDGMSRVRRLLEREGPSGIKTSAHVQCALTCGWFLSSTLRMHFSRPALPGRETVGRRCRQPLTSARAGGVQRGTVQVQAVVSVLSVSLVVSHCSGQCSSHVHRGRPPLPCSCPPNGS
jgi:hypothetical protein